MLPASSNKLSFAWMNGVSELAVERIAAKASDHYGDLILVHM